MALVSLLDVSLSFGGAPLLDRVNLQIDRGERVCLVGRNGAGKSTLMKVINGELKPDTGQVFRQPGAIFCTLRQEVPTGLTGTVRSVVEGESGSYDEHNDWERHDRVERLLESMGLPADAAYCSRRAWPGSRSSCCSTSRPTTWISSQSSGWRNSCSNGAARCCS
jgi:ATP-binding cassette subfamily F protein uup